VPIVLTAKQIEGRLEFGNEARGLELKGPGPRSDKHLLAKVARAALSLGNLRDGGHVIIGIDDGDPTKLGPGLEDDDLASWIAYDDLARNLANYADPPLKFNVAAIELSSGAKVAVIEVFEFADIPHFCAKEREGVLREGALYVRPRKVPETSEVASPVEMREIVELATQKALRAYVEMAERADVTLASGPRPPSSDELYEAEEAQGWE
jgi:predicted HTH transcriptional regulator